MDVVPHRQNRMINVLLKPLTQRTFGRTFYVLWSDMASESKQRTTAQGRAIFPPARYLVTVILGCDTDSFYPFPEEANLPVRQFSHAVPRKGGTEAERDRALLDGEHPLEAAAQAAFEFLGILLAERHDEGLEACSFFRAHRAYRAGSDPGKALYLCRNPGGVDVHAADLYGIIPSTCGQEVPVIEPVEMILQANRAVWGIRE